jgi:heme-degrading monooxygenase HmoA
MSSTVPERELTGPSYRAREKLSSMVLEVALIDVTPGQEDAFAAAYLEARQQIESAPGSRSIRMTRGIETPDRFVLLVEWDSVEAHDEFRAGEGFTIWRGLIGPHFANPPHVEHFTDVSA